MNKNIGIEILKIGGSCLLLYLGYIYYKNCTTQDIRKNNAKSHNHIEEEVAKNESRIKFDNVHTDNKIKEAKAKSEIKIEEKKAILKLKKEMLASYPPNTVLVSKSYTSLRTWAKEFHKKFHTPSCSAIPLLSQILPNSPKDYRDALLFHLLTSFGAICFSKVRAKYLDGKIHSPSLLTVIEGESGSGKSYFQTIYNSFFQRIIESDLIKHKKDSKKQIIQTVGINMSNAQFMDILASNKGVHFYIMEDEIIEMKKAFQKQNGLNFAIIRKAFDNGIIYQNNKNNQSTKGSYPVYLNATFTGTPKAINSLFKDEEVEGGSARRFCFSTIPEQGATSPMFKWFEGEMLENIRNNIDEWRNTYSYHHNFLEGDTPCDEFIIDLEYINKELQKWLEKQYYRYKNESVEERNAMRNSMACIAFHCAIVLHMMAGNPDSTQSEKRNNVKKITVYIANYCMERYLYKFSKGYNLFLQKEKNNICENPTVKQPMKKLSEEDVKYWYHKRDGNAIGYGSIAKKLGTTKDEVRNAFKKYEKEFLRQ